MGPLVVLAYSGGLDTSAIVPWLRERYGARVVCFAADVGQGGGELAGLAEKAKRSGAADCVIEDLREEFVRDFVFPTLRAGAVYARTYLLGTSMARPAIAAHQVALAQRIGAQAVAHGCTGKGNDQVRFELTYTALAPELQVIAPWREWAFKGREDLIAYVRAKGIPVQATVEKPYSTDRNLWHCSHEGGILEDPSQEAPEHIFVMTKNPVDAPAEPVVVHVGFEEGTPVAVDHVPLGPVELLEALIDVAGEHGVGRADVVEDRLVGMKSRGVYETPGRSVSAALCCVRQEQHNHQKGRGGLPPPLRPRNKDGGRPRSSAPRAGRRRVCRLMPRPPPEPPPPPPAPPPPPPHQMWGG